jgi:uncharacterized damage-inducible protein DinB
VVSQIDAWLRGPVAGVAPVYQPVAHALLHAAEDAVRGLHGLTVEQVWARPGGAASVGFHVKHLVGALDRLFAYALDRPLTETQREWLRSEAEAGNPPQTADQLAALVRAAVDQAIAVLRTVPAEAALEPRAVGRARLLTTVLGALFHAAEHSARHAGQIVTTATVLRSGS